MRCLLSIRSLFLATATHIQVALNVAVPASSLCINRLLYRIARMKIAGTAEDRRIVIIDLLIGVGIPVLQMVLRECV
jgi:pheromone a factor receptor